jgi:hypothetical protein
MQEPRAWQVGDLITVRGEYRGIVLAVSKKQTWWISETGDWITGFITYDMAPALFSHTTGLTYVYKSPEQVWDDFENGFFTPYFLTQPQK